MPLEFELVGRHVETTDELEDYVTSKLEKAPKFFNRIHSLKAILDVEGINYEAEFIASLVKGDQVVAKADAKDVYAAIDAASEKLEAQLRKYKDKLNEHRPRGEQEPPGPARGEEPR